MAWALRPFSTRLIEQAQREQEQEALKAEGRAFRGWHRTGFGEQLRPSPGQLNPQGFQYEQAKAIRPGAWPSRLRQPFQDVSEIVGAHHAQLQQRHTWSGGQWNPLNRQQQAPAQQPRSRIGEGSRPMPAGASPIPNRSLSQQWNPQPLPRYPGQTQEAMPLNAGQLHASNGRQIDQIAGMSRRTNFGGDPRRALSGALGAAQQRGRTQAEIQSARQFAPTDIMEQQMAAFRGESPLTAGRRRRGELAAATRGMDEHQLTMLERLHVVLSENRITNSQFNEARQAAQQGDKEAAQLLQGVQQEMENPHVVIRAATARLLGQKKITTREANKMNDGHFVDRGRDIGVMLYQRGMEDEAAAIQAVVNERVRQRKAADPLGLGVVGEKAMDAERSRFNPFNAEQKYIANKLEPGWQYWTKKARLPYSEKVGTGLSQMFVPSSLIPFGAGKGPLVARMAKLALVGGAVGMEQQAGYERQHGHEPTLEDRLTAAASGAIGAVAIDRLGAALGPIWRGLKAKVLSGEITQDVAEKTLQHEISNALPDEDIIANAPEPPAAARPGVVHEPPSLAAPEPAELLPGSVAPPPVEPGAQHIPEKEPGTLYHGTGAQFDSFTEDMPSGTALFGPGVYLTDEPSTAAVYARKSAKKLAAQGKEAAPEIRQYRLTGNENLIDLEKPLPNDVVATLKRFSDMNGYEADAYDAAYELAAKGANGRLVYREFRNGLSDLWLSTGDAAESMQGLNDSIHGLGYDGFTHLGGVGRPNPHNVTILFDTETANPLRHVPARNVEPGAVGAAVPPAAPASPARPIPADVGGGAPLTGERLMDRPDPAEVVRVAMSARPGREAREAWRKVAGAAGESNLQRRAWSDQLYQDARKAGVKLVPGAGADRQSDEVIGITERILGDPKARAPVGQFPESQRALVQSLYDRADEVTARIIAADPDFEPFAMDKYFPSMFTSSAKGRGRYGRGFNLRPGFTQGRTRTGLLGEFLDSRPDLDLATWDPVALMARHEAAADNYIAALEAVRGLKAKGLIVPAKDALPGWRAPDIAPFKIKQKLQGWAAEPKVATTLDQMFGTSAFDEHGALRALKTVREKAFMVKVFGGLFQGIDYTFRQAGLGLSELARAHPVQAARAWFSPIRAVARAALPQLDRQTIARAAANPKLSALYRNGLAAGVDPSISDQAIRGMGSLVPQTIGGHEIPLAKGLAQVLEFVGGGAYKKFHTEMLEQAGLVNLEKNLRGGLPLEEAARRGAEETNVFFSSIPNWQSAVKSATARDLLKFPFFATGELEGWFRLPFQAPAGFAGLIGGTVIAAEMLNKSFTGKWLSEEQLNPYAEGSLERLKNDPIRGSTGLYNTKFLRPELPWKGPDDRTLYLDLLGQADTPFRWALDPMFATQTRLGQIPRAAMDIAAITHGDAPAFGEKVRGPKDLAKFAAQEVAPITVAGLAGTERGRIGTLGAGFQVGGVNISAEPLREVRARTIADELKAGKLKGPYTDEQGKPIIPDRYGDLTKADKLYMDEHHRNLFAEKFSATSRETLADVTGRQKSAESGHLFDLTKTKFTDEMDTVKVDAKDRTFGDPATYDARKALDGQVKIALDHRRAKMELIIEDNPDFFTPGAAKSAEDRAIQKLSQVYERHGDLKTEEDWAALEADLAKSLTPAEAKLAQQAGLLDDHPVERQRKELNEKANPYYDIPKGTTKAGSKVEDRAKLLLRFQKPEVDAALWALGRISKVRTARARTLAAQYIFDLYGVRVPVSRIEISTDGAPADGGGRPTRGKRGANNISGAEPGGVSGEKLPGPLPRTGSADRGFGAQFASRGFKNSLQAASAFARSKTFSQQYQNVLGELPRDIQVVMRSKVHLVRAAMINEGDVMERNPAGASSIIVPPGAEVNDDTKSLLRHEFAHALMDQLGVTGEQPQHERMAAVSPSVVLTDTGAYGGLSMDELRKLLASLR